MPEWSRCPRSRSFPRFTDDSQDHEMVVPTVTNLRSVHRFDPRSVFWKQIHQHVAAYQDGASTLLSISAMKSVWWKVLPMIRWWYSRWWRDACMISNIPKAFEFDVAYLSPNGKKPEEILPFLILHLAGIGIWMVFTLQKYIEQRHLRPIISNLLGNMRTYSTMKCKWHDYVIEVKDE